MLALTQSAQNFNLRRLSLRWNLISATQYKLTSFAAENSHDVQKLQFFCADLGVRRIHLALKECAMHSAYALRTFARRTQ